MKTRKYNAKFKEPKGLASHAIKTGSLVILLCCALIGYGQDGSVSMSVSYDTVYLGNPLHVAYTYSNVSCGHERPDFPESWVTRGGPNTSIQTSMSNGVTRNEEKYTYVFNPQEVGSYELKPIICSDIESEGIIIHVVENPDEIKQELPRSTHSNIWMGRGAWDLNPSSPAPDQQEQQMEPIKPKRKTYKL